MNSISEGNLAHDILPADATEVCVWWIRMEASEERFASHWKHLNTAEQTRAQRFRREADRIRFVACRSVLRQVLAACLQTVASEVRLAEGKYGKPHLAEDSDARKWSFNVAHSGELGCVALARGYPIGVDIEAPRSPSNLDLLCEKILGDGEMEQYRSTAPEERLRTFLRFWTLKEALVKAIGLGLQAPLAELEIDLRSPRRLLRVPHRLGTASDFYLEELEPPRVGYFSAIAVASERMPKLRCQEWTGDLALVGCPRH